MASKPWEIKYALTNVHEKYLPSILFPTISMENNNLENYFN